jgi:acyl-coenzyme A thioesterase PaaI-like protein
MSDAGRALADELRGLLHDLAARDNSVASLGEARASIRAARAALDGEPQSRWDGAARSRYTDHTLYGGAHNAMAPPLQLSIEARHDGTPIAVGRVRCGSLYEGPPGGVHGGYVAGLFDDVLGRAQVLADGPTGVTGTLSVRYKQLTPIDTDLVFEAWIDRVSGRRVVVRGTCSAGTLVTAEAEALFVRVDLAAMAARAANG